jgi:hypothetical protein
MKPTSQNIATERSEKEVRTSFLRSNVDSMEGGQYSKGPPSEGQVLDSRLLFTDLPQPQAWPFLDGPQRAEVIASTNLGPIHSENPFSHYQILNYPDTLALNVQKLQNGQGVLSSARSFRVSPFTGRQVLQVNHTPTHVPAREMKSWAGNHR